MKRVELFFRKPVLFIIIWGFWLIPLFASFPCAAFQIHTVPTGAVVTVLGTNEFLGITPTGIHKIRMDQHMGYLGMTPGRWYDVLIQKEGYYNSIQRFFVPYNQRYESAAIKNPQTFFFYLRPITFLPIITPPPWYSFYKTKVLITSDPPNVAIYIDGDYRGHTPCNIDLVWKSNEEMGIQLQFEKPGYTTRYRILTPQENRIHIVMQPIRNYRR